MRGLLTVVATGAVIGLGYWAYHQNIQTKEAIREVSRLQSQIGVERERLEVLQDEWAYLTRPDRLRALVELDFDRYQLVPMMPEQFAQVGDIVYPPTPAEREAELLLGNASEANP